MKIMMLRKGRWAWAVRRIGMLGQAYGEAGSREQAVEQAMERINELWPKAVM